MKELTISCLKKTMRVIGSAAITESVEATQNMK